MKYEVWFGVREFETIKGEVLKRIGDTILYYEKVNIGKLNSRTQAIHRIHHYYTPDIIIIEKPTNKIIFNREGGKKLFEIKEEK